MTQKEYTNLVLPKDSGQLFEFGKLNRLPRDEEGDVCSGFEDAKRNDSVDKFDLETADTSQVTNMSHMFHKAESFDQDISGWDVSCVEDMRGMFESTESFNQDISGWDVSSVTEMDWMFYNTESFEQDLSEWDLDHIDQKQTMFYGAKYFNWNIHNWTWSVEIINFAFNTKRFEALCERLDTNVFDEIMLCELSDTKLQILVEKDLINKETAISNSI